jgi:orotate phosphoribosyltransferase
MKNWLDIYKQKDALWLHDGNPKRPHALFTSGLHSDSAFNGEMVMEDAALLHEASADLLHILIEQGLDIEKVDRVVGPAMGAITLAHDVARQIAQKRNRPCLRAYAEKESDRQNSPMIFKRTMLQPNEKILVVEDTLTTGGSVQRMINAITATHAETLPFVAVLVNRSILKEVDGRKVIALIDYPLQAWTAEECPLCKNGSEVVRPKGKENWAKLHANY